MGEYLWSPDGSKLGFVSTDRFHKNSTAKLADTTNGEVRTLFTETEKTHVQTRVQWQILWDIERGPLVLAARRHRADVSLRSEDRPARRTRSRPAPVRSRASPSSITTTRTMWYEAVGKEKGQDPYFTHLYRVGLDGKNNVSLTPDNGTHSVQISPDGKYVVDTFSQPDVAPETTLRDGATGRADHAAREGRHLEAARDRLEAADADQDDGRRRQDRDLRHALPADELRSDEEVSDHQQRLSRAAVGQRRIARVHRGARRQAGARRTRLRRRQHRRHRHAEPIEGLSPTPTTARWGATTRSRIRSPA